MCVCRHRAPVDQKQPSLRRIYRNNNQRYGYDDGHQQQQQRQQQQQQQRQQYRQRTYEEDDFYSSRGRNQGRNEEMYSSSSMTRVQALKTLGLE